MRAQHAVNESFEDDRSYVVFFIPLKEYIYFILPKGDFFRNIAIEKMARKSLTFRGQF